MSQRTLQRLLLAASLLFALLVGAGCDTTGTAAEGYVSENENDHYHLAKIYIQEGRFKEAERELERAESLREEQDPEHDVDLAFSHMRLGYISTNPADRTRHYTRGIELANRAALKRPQLADPRAIAGYMYLELGQNQQAISEYLAAIHLSPLDARYHMNLGEAYRRTGNIQAARDAYANAALADKTFAPKVEAKLQELR